MSARTDEELKRASHDLFYEYEMMRRLAPTLHQEPDTTTRNARLESFLVHVRNLTVFLGWRTKKPHPADVRAVHFVEGFTSKPPQDGWLAELYESVCTQIVHLSYDRSKVDPVKKSWPIREIVECVSKELGAICAAGAD